MPTFQYVCDKCGHERDHRREVSLRNHADPCPECIVGWLRRKFVPTVNIMTPEHFRHLQSDFLPPKGDPKWDDLIHVSEVKAKQSTEVQDNFRKALEAEHLANG